MLRPLLILKNDAIKNIIAEIKNEMVVINISNLPSYYYDPEQVCSDTLRCTPFFGQ